ncbi:4-oxalomesaconate hydratase [Xanthomonas citri pv. fuscans]|uniref:4-oxalomesaconate hydratase n=2 Tax=Xanthomonas citri TaxID=346 RepID=A0AB33C9X9_XANCI|nr:4-oxalomesaconate hydratase [Xanthomonas citri pv. vignicola]QWN05383.1 4-oxalomesaconate hydratase [Xanthomonas citri pv. fuscans]RTE56015.1 4-oxalomesaconate hydratase [Xanthomonas axonopodis pv. eucalyptorum]ASL03096.1 4-oxalomesaconate hydratase [Xanthomonas citri pv. vignicola]QWN09587.1 4-oxalomesaconate hydratase [Xanthomonas citri pv. fuscans]
MPFEEAIATQCVAIRAHLHIGTTTSTAACSVRAPGQPTLRTGNRWRAASAATHTPSP